MCIILYVVPFGTSPEKIVKSKGLKEKSKFSKISSSDASKLAAPVVCKLPEPASQSKQLQNKNLSSGFPPMSETAPSSFSQQSSKVSFGTELQQKNIENKDGNINSFSLSLPSAMKSDVIDKNTDVSNREKKVSFSLINTNKVGVEPTEQIANNRMESKLVENQVEKIPTNKEINYYSILSNFYQKHNPTKVGEVEKTLNKYKVSSINFSLKLSL